MEEKETISLMLVARRCARGGSRAGNRGGTESAERAVPGLSAASGAGERSATRAHAPSFQSYFLLFLIFIYLELFLEGGYASAALG